MDVNYNACKIKKRVRQSKARLKPLELPAADWKWVLQCGEGHHLRKWWVWNTATKKYNKFKFCSPSKFKELNVIFESCIWMLLCIFVVPKTPLPTTYVDFLMSDPVYFAAFWFVQQSYNEMPNFITDQQKYLITTIRCHLPVGLEDHIIIFHVSFRTPKDPINFFSLQWRFIR